MPPIKALRCVQKVMMMRKALKQLNGERRRFVGVFVRLGTKNGWKGRTLTTVLLKDIKDANGRLVCDHLWFNLTKEFGSLVLKEGTVISFDARVKSYYRGYRGSREDVYDKPVKLDFKLSHPTKVQVIPYTAEYEAKVRELQETAVWHLLKADGGHEVYCGEKSTNTIATDDVYIVECPKCLELFEKHGVTNAKN